MKLHQLGAFGHSMGGAAAGQAAVYDTRIGAAANWDGTQWGDVIDNVFSQPFLLLSHSQPAPHFSDMNPQAYHRKSKQAFYKVKIAGTSHTNYTDIPYWIGTRKLTGAGPIDMNKGVSIITKVTLSFFDQHLLGKAVKVNDLKKDI